MDVVETQSEGLTRGFKITVPAAELSQRQEARLTDLGQNAHIAGFRPGKVPLKILKQRFGRTVLGEVLEAAVQEATQKTLEDRGMRAATPPKIEAEEFREDQDFAYQLTVEILPEIEPDDFSKYEIERLKVEASDDDIAEALDQVVEQRQTTEPIAPGRAAAAGDIAVIDFSGKVDGEEFPGGSGEDYVLTLGSGQFIPGFEDQI
ncbi:MAG: trigger factor, partial [Alphaproteobacteria bacterium]|nr:trigger factor [Alphaproteobacteria bacterium]